MKWLLVAAPIVVALVAAVLTILVIGILLPRMHTATRSALYKASPQQVWEVITDFPGRAAWIPGLKSVERLPDRNGHASWKDVRSDGWTMPVEIEVADAPKELVTRIIDDGMPFGGRWTWEVTPEGAGSRLRITEDGETKVAMFRYFAALGDMSSTMRGVLSALGKKFGEPVTIEP